MRDVAKMVVKDPKNEKQVLLTTVCYQKPSLDRRQTFLSGSVSKASA